MTKKKPLLPPSPKYYPTFTHGKQNPVFPHKSKHNAITLDHKCQSPPGIISSRRVQLQMIHWGFKKSAQHETVYMRCDFFSPLDLLIPTILTERSVLQQSQICFSLLAHLNCLLGILTYFLRLYNHLFLQHTHSLCAFSFYKEVEQFAFSYFGSCYLSR